MISKYLFPNYFKKVGWVLIIIGLLWPTTLVFFHRFPKIPIKVFAIYSGYGKTDPGAIGYEYNRFDDPKTYTSSFRLVPARKHWFITLYYDYSWTIISILLIAGGIFVSFSKRKSEDEFISRIRLDSLLWATYINYIFLVLGLLFFFGEDFAGVLIMNMLTILIFFLIRFNYILYKTSKALTEEDKIKNNSTNNLIQH